MRRVLPASVLVNEGHDMSHVHQLHSPCWVEYKFASLRSQELQAYHVVAP